MKIIAIIPVHGRHPLLKITIERLYRKNKIDHVICVGEEDNRKLCKKTGAEFILHTNKPIGKKLNAAFTRAGELKADAVSFVGSSDWLNDNWFDIIAPLTERYELIGKRECNMVHLTDKVEMICWPGYPIGSGREMEPIGIGRVLSSSFMDKINWRPFEDFLDNSLDFSMMIKLQKANGSCLLYNSEEIQSLSISCDLWSNMHSFKAQSVKSIKYVYPEKWLEMWFPEILNYKEWNQIKNTI